MDRIDLGTVVDSVGLTRMVLAMRRIMSPWITTLTYHRVARPDDAAMLDDGVVDVAPAQLDRQLAFLTQWFSPIGIGDLCAFVRGSRRLPPNPLLVTFDDGYRDNHDVALPILAKHGVRATFFVATDYVDRRRMYWWDRVSLVIKRSPRERLELSYPFEEELSIAGPQGRRQAIRRALRIVKDVPGLDLERFIEELERAAAVSLSYAEERTIVDLTVMTWNHVLALRAAGMDVQSHTHTHRVLQTLPRTEIDRELRVSRQILEEVLGEPVRAISYPVGRSLAHAPDVLQAVRDAGYELGFSNGTGVNRTTCFKPLDAKRISLDIAMPDPFFRAVLALPWLAY